MTRKRDARTKQGLRRWSQLALLAVGLAAGLLGVHRMILPFDEGYILYGALRVLQGDVPYRDFWLVYAPAQFYAVAGLFALFGPSVMVVRIFDVLVRVAILLAMERLATRLAGSLAGACAAGLAILPLSAVQFYGYPMFPAMGLSLLSLLLLLRGIRAPAASAVGGSASIETRAALESFEEGGPGLSLLAWSGFAAGVATLFRHDVGIYLVISASGGFAARFLSRRQEIRSELVGLLSFAAGLAAALVPVAAAFLLAVPTSVLWRDLVVFPLKVLNVYRSLPLPPFPPHLSPRGEFDPSLLLYFPMAVFGVTLAAGLLRRGWRDLLIPGLLGAGFLRQGVNRVDYIHLLPAGLLACVLVPVLAQRVARSPRRWLRLPALALLVLPAAHGFLLMPAREIADSARGPSPPRATLERARGVPLYPGQEDAVAYVRSHTREGEAIFVGHIRHDWLMANDIAFYFLADRPCATRYFDLCPGVITTRQVQEEVVQDLERKRVRMVVLLADLGSVREPNASGISSGVKVLDEYIRRTFGKVALFGDYLVLRRQGE